MKRKTTITTMFLATAALLGTFALAAAPQVASSHPYDQYGSGPGYGHGGPGPEMFGHGMRHHGGFGPPCGRIGFAAEHLERIVGVMDLNEAQQAAWKDLSAATKTATDRLDEACKDRDDWGGTSPERLARMETMMSAGLDAVREVRPRFEAFYDTLSDTQKEALDDLMVHRRHGHPDRWSRRD